MPRHSDCIASIEQHPAVGMSKNLLNETRVERMSRALGEQVSDKRYSEQRKISDQVQDLMTHELIGKAKARLIKNTVLREHDRIVQIAPLPEPASPNGFHLLQESKCPSICNLMLKSMS